MLCNHMMCPPLVSLKLFWDVVIFYRTGHPCRWLGFNGSLLRRFLLDTKGENAAVLTPQWPVENPGRDVQLPCDLLRRQMEDCAGLFWPSQKNNNKKHGVADKGRLAPFTNLGANELNNNNWPVVLLLVVSNARFTNPLLWHSLATPHILNAQGLSMSPFAMGKLAETGKELCEEREEALAVCNA